MPRRQLIDHICTLRCIGEECANKLDQFLSLIVDESTFIKEVANVCQGCLLEEKRSNRSEIFCLQKRRTKSSERYENLSHVGTHPTTKGGYIHVGKVEG